MIKRVLRKELLGYTAVDSGQLLVIDPCYIDSQWKNDGDFIGIEFWGEGREEVHQILSRSGFEVENIENRVSFIRLHDESYVEYVKREIQNASKKAGKVVVCHEKTTSTYEKISDLTLSEKQGGQLNFDLGHEGLGVAFSSGLGDGLYPVYAYYENIDGCGEMIVKVEIELVSEEDSDDEEE